MLSAKQKLSIEQIAEKHGLIFSPALRSCLLEVAETFNAQVEEYQQANAEMLQLHAKLADEFESFKRRSRSNAAAQRSGPG